MASRALLQRASGRGALHRIHRVSVPSTVYLSKSFSTRYTNDGILYNTSSNTFNITISNITKANNIKNSRHFSTSTTRTKEPSKMSEEEVSGLKVKEDRLMRDLHETCEWGKGERWGR